MGRRVGIHGKAGGERSCKYLQIHKLQAMEGHQARIVVVTCKLPLDNPRLLVWRDLNFKTRPYSSPGAYSQSKIALAVWGSDLANRFILDLFCPADPS
jgi:hypothetical protein